MSDRILFFQLLAASLSGLATTEELQQLNELLAGNEELKHYTEALQDMWREPEADQQALSAAWKKLKKVQF
jgi:hypothetical protein